MSIEMNWDDATQEMLTYLQELIRINTSPGRQGETLAASYINSILEANGLSGTVIEPMPGKGSLVYKQAGVVPKESLLLLSHIDVAPVHETDRWKYPPFDGIYASGEIWGRGAIDCKSVAVVWLMIVLLLHRSKASLKRGLVYAATADEESGGSFGTRWILEHTDLFSDCRFALNEGGGFSFRTAKSECYTLQYGEKGHMVWEFHSNEQKQCKPQILNVKPFEKEPLEPMMKAFLEGSTLRRQLASYLPYSLKHKLLAYLNRTLPFDYSQLFYQQIQFEVMPQRNTPTKVRLHWFPLPAAGEEEYRRFLKHVDPILGYIKDSNIVSRILPSFSPVRSPLFELITASMKHEHKRVIPYVTPGATDSRFLRAAGIEAYGFFPTPPDTDIRLIHKPNERISADAMRFALKHTYNIVYTFLTT